MNSYMNKPYTTNNPDWYYVEDESIIGQYFVHKETGVRYCMLNTNIGVRLVDDNVNLFALHSAWAQRKHEFEKV